MNGYFLTDIGDRVNPWNMFKNNKIKKPDSAQNLLDKRLFFSVKEAHV